MSAARTTTTTTTAKPEGEKKSAKAFRVAARTSVRATNWAFAVAFNWLFPLSLLLIVDLIFNERTNSLCTSGIFRNFVDISVTITYSGDIFRVNSHETCRWMFRHSSFNSHNEWEFVFQMDGIVLIWFLFLLFFFFLFFCLSNIALMKVFRYFHNFRLPQSLAYL